MSDMPFEIDVLKDLKLALNRGENSSVFGLTLGEKALFLCGQKRQIVYVTNSVSDADKISQIFKSFGKTTKEIFFSPADKFSFSSSLSDLATKNIDALYSLVSENVDVVFVSPLALIQKYSPKKLFENSILSLKVKQIINQKDLVKSLISIGYSRADAVESKGEFAVRGDIVDVFIPILENPIRIEFFDDEIETMYYYNIENYKKIKDIKKCDIVPNLLFNIDAETQSQILKKVSNNFEKTQKSLGVNESVRLRTKFEEFKVNFEAKNFGYIKNWIVPFAEFDTIFDYFNDDALIVFDDVKYIYDAIQKEYEQFYDEYKSMLLSGEILDGQSDYLIAKNDALKISKQKISFQQITTSNRVFNPTYVASFRSSTQTNYFGNYDLLAEDLKYFSEFNYTVIICAGTKQLAGYLQNFLSTKKIETVIVELNIEKNKINIIPKNVPYGANFIEDKIAIIGTNELQKKSTPKKVATSDKKEEFTLPKIGDFVVHETFGVGECVAIEKMKFTDYQKDYIIIKYEGGDKLYLPTEQIGLISTYVSGGKAPKLNKLGSKEFEKTKAKVKSSLKELAFNLVELYKKRESMRGVKYELDKKLYAEFENSFPYEETPDQVTAINDILNDMTAGKIMDRIVCGDVGYGKTEVAIRSAFLAVMNNKQVAFLAPTTVLSEQHFGTAKSRLQNFGVRVECLNRFKTKAEQKKIIEQLKNGEIDVICGTHRLLSKDIEFKDLGLLVLDEEQRFGVGDKEKIKTLKNNVDVLTLSATPIPRTLHMGLVGIRDISIIATPPKERMAVETTITEYNDTLVVNAIKRELARGGQALVIYNKVESIADFSSKIKSLLGDDVSVSFAHGQMDSEKLETEIYNLYSGKTQVLVSTTLIENGIDLPNANTLVIVDADKLGLSQLYQLRGRVGRGKNLGYAYFTYTKDKMLSGDAYKRLNAIMEFTELGSGFKIAMKDLEIRGCGNILGAEQSGHMAKVGYDMYVKILNEAVSEIKGQKAKVYRDLKLNIATNCYIPENYIPSSDERFTVYNNLKSIKSSKDREAVLNSIGDTYGEVPQEIKNLAYVAELQNIAREFDVKRISIDREKCQIEFYDSEHMLSKLLSKTLKDMGIKNYFAQTGFVNNLNLSEFSVKRKLELVTELFEKALNNWLKVYFLLDKCFDYDIID